MENKGQNTMSRIMVNRILTEELVSYYVNRLFNEKPWVFIHSVNVAYLVAEISYTMGFEHYDELVRGALLHDIGKLDIPNNILLKREKLTDEEFTLIQNHPKAGYEMIKDENVSELVKDIILHHHEKLNGSGYPDKLKSPDISQEIQIVTVCDIYDALTEKRSYGQEYTMAEALAIMHKEPINTKFSNMIKGCLDK